MENFVFGTVFAIVNFNISQYFVIDSAYLRRVTKFTTYLFITKGGEVCREAKTSTGLKC